ncbi:hypothetical protein EJ06DRAFT_532083 [Trichodelitschia bisporula]|uniref:Cell division control protein n=1 Tax=Trichodelitschia bisporula TaxID=703511 RepID=A0A6G1HR02_9PEZI|nr:hypothetical protein EJ06DRAFT_532083 [Trichodelitschia bisporula]
MVAEPPSVQRSFANNFWGKDDAGVSPLLERMHNAKVTCDELKSFYTTRAAIEEEYARKLLNLSRKPLGSAEGGTLRLSFDVIRSEVETMAKAHQNIAGQMKSELEEPLAAFAGGMKERRKIIQTGIEKLLKLKTQQTIQVNKARDRYEQDCLKIKGYLAQGHMVMGQEERKNKAKLEKTQVQLSSTSNEYEAAVKVLEETTGRWNRDWKAGCDKFQDLEEERLDFMKSSLWTFANISSTVCVSDDASCEKIRLSLEDCDVEKDITFFIKEHGTGQEIPDPPKFIDFCRGDINDSASDASDEAAYTVAQFPRPINPALRTSSPQPSVFESHHDPNSALARDLAHKEPVPPVQEPVQKKPQPSAAAAQRQQSYPDPRRTANGQHPYQQGNFAMSASEIPTVPHDPYPMDGMTQFCRTGPPMGPPSDLSSAASPVRSPSRDSTSEYSNPTSFSSMEPPNVPSPMKQMNSPTVTPVEEDPSPKKRGMFNSPFRRKSKHEKENPLQQNSPSAPSNRNTWTPSTARKAGIDLNNTPSRTYGQGSRGTILRHERPSPSPEPVDPRANFQLNVGNNLFDVASPDNKKARDFGGNQAYDEMDPIAQALEELKGVTKAGSLRVSADRYAGLATPAPPGTPGHPGTPAGSVPTPLVNSHIAAAQRGTPPPSYDQPVSRLGAPPAAHTARAMKETTKKYVSQKQNLFESPSQQSRTHQRSQSYFSRPSGRGSSDQQDLRQNQEVIRATSPAPSRSVSPRPGLYEQNSRQPQQPQQSQGYQEPSQQGYRSGSQASYRPTSPNPYAATAPQPAFAARPRANTTSPAKPVTNFGGYSSRQASPSASIPRALSPQPQFQAQSRLSSSRGSASGQGMALQLASAAVQNEYSGSVRGRPSSQYYGGSNDYGSSGQVATQVRSKSVAEPRQFSREGRPILFYARTMYLYQPQIPEELGFAKGDVLAVLHQQDDGWWEAEVVGRNDRPGLVPSNYLQRI